MSSSLFSRRRFLRAACATATTLGLSSIAWSDDLPPVTDPRASDGDDVHEPKWDERFTITVGPAKADLVGTSDRVIQAAVDTIARRGGGTVQLLPGTYTLRNAVFLPSKIRLLGSGPESIITKIPSETVALADDSNWFDQEITLAEAKGFRVGDGVLIRAENPHNNGTDYIKRTLVARSGKRFKLSDGLRENVWLAGKPTCSSLFPLLTSENTADVVIENLTLDGNGANNENLNGNYAGCIFLQDCNRYTIRKVEARNYNGDGISFQVCHDVVIDECHCHDNTDLGVHPGSGSQRPLDPQFADGGQQHRPLLVLGRQVRAGRGQPDRRQPQLRNLDRPLRYRQRDAEEPHHRQRQGRHPVPRRESGARFLAQSQPARRERHCR